MVGGRGVGICGRDSRAERERRDPATCTRHAPGTYLADGSACGRELIPELHAAAAACHAKEEAEVVARTGRPTTATASFRASGVRLLVASSTRSRRPRLRAVRAVCSCRCARSTTCSEDLLCIL